MTYTAEIRMILTALLIVFMVLKFTGLVDWSWWLVLAPFWVPAIVALIGLLIWILLVLRERR